MRKKRAGIVTLLVAALQLTMRSSPPSSATGSAATATSSTDEAEDDDNKHKHYDKKDEKGQELVVKKEHVLTNEEIDNFSKNTAHHDETELNTSYERIRRCPIEADTHEDEKVSLFVSQRKRIRTLLWKR